MILSVVLAFFTQLSVWVFPMGEEGIFTVDLDLGTDWPVGSSIKSTLRICCILCAKIEVRETCP